jgi:hypothetical protein
MKRGLLGWLVGIFLLSAMVLLVGFNLTKTRILVLHSGQRSSGWDERIDDGIRTALSRNRQPVSVHWHYLSLERFPHESGRRDAAAQARRAIEQLRPHVVLAVDDEAQAYVARHYAVPAGSAQAGKPSTRIVFAAIDSQPASYGYDTAANVSGVLERLPLAAMRETLLTLRNGQPARLAVIGPAGPTGFAEIHQVQAFDWRPHRLAAAQALPDFATLQKAIPRLDSLADVLIVLSFGGLPQGDGSSSPTTMKEVASWIETHAKALPIGVDTAFVEGGGALAIEPSPREMGEVAMQMSLEWLRAVANGRPAAPPVVAGIHYRVALRQSALRARGLALPSIYVEAARLDRNFYP